MKKRTTKPYVQMKPTGGRLVPHYRLTWWDNGKRRERFIRLPENMDSPEFDKAYWAIRSGKSEALQKPAKDTWAELVTAYRSHPKFKNLAAGTRVAYDRVLSEIVEKNGKRPVSALTRVMVREVHAKHAATPRKADWRVQILRLLFNFARDTLDWDVENPAEGIELYGKQREFEPWPEWLVEKLAEAPDMVRTTAELILGTGQRPAAAIGMRYDQFNGDWMQVHDDKGNQSFDVYAPAQLTTFIAARKKAGAHVLAKNLTQPIGYDAVEKSFRKWRASLGDPARPYVLHGLRKLAIIRLAEAGCSDAQIQAITGQSAEMVAYYRQRASRKTLSKGAIRLLEQNKNET